MNSHVFRRAFIACAAAGFALGLVSSLEAQRAVERVNKDSRGAALRGYDAVAYFKQGLAVRGLPQISYMWNGAAWYFASAESRDDFAAHPEQYAPQFGGYCAWAVGHGYTAPGDPEAWSIVDGRLFLNYDKRIQKKWEQDQHNLIEQGMRNWPGLIR